MKFASVKLWVSTVLVAAVVGAGAAWAQTTSGAGDDAVVLAKGPAGHVTLAEVKTMVNLVVPLNERKNFFANAGNIEQMALVIYSPRALAGQARQHGYDRQPEVLRDLALGEQRTLSDSWVNHQAGRKLPTDAQLEQFARTTYNADAKRFTRGEQVQARHILVAAKGEVTEAQAQAKAADLLAQLNKGASFEALAREHSDDKGSAARGGDLGKFGRGRMVPPFEEAVFALTSPGQRSGLVKSQFGYHIIELTGKEPAGKVSFDEVKDELKKEALERLDGQNRRMLWDEAQKGIEYDQAAIEAQARAAGGAKP